MSDDTQDSTTEPEPQPESEVEGHGSNLNSSKSNMYRAPGDLGLRPPDLKAAEEPRWREADR